MDNLLDHNSQASEWVTYAKKSATDPTHESDKRGSRGVFEYEDYGRTMLERSFSYEHPWFQG